MSNPKIEPCPFCGSEAKVIMINDAGNYNVHCTKCPADMGRQWFWKQKDAINAWNKRIKNVSK